LKRFPSLDGLRAVSIALVLTGHTLRFSRAGTFGDLANLGVRWFFVISGFLITSLLLQEARERGTISLGRFYARRTLRIFPAFYAFLALLFVATRLGWVAPLGARSWAHALTYTMDYAPLEVRAWSVGHLWSLAVEEQFYLVWPTLLVVLGARRGLVSAALVIVAVPLVRYATWRWAPAHAPDMKWQFHTVCDALAAGCLMAGVRDALWERPVYQRLLRSWAFAVVPLGVLAVNWYATGRPRVSYLAAQTAMNLGIALCVDRVVRCPDDLVGRVLNLRVVAYVGALSYSIYLWQQPFFDHTSHSFATRTPINLVFIFALAAASYHLVEKPFLAMRARFEPARPA
jgi:peptidoglycan/LPS O-acetylase OafA/YrhL